jgi:hypothetical protein
MKFLPKTNVKKLSMVAGGILVSVASVAINMGLAFGQQTPPSQPSEESQMSETLSRNMTRFSFIGLAANNTLVRFGSGRFNVTRSIKVRGIDGNLVGIDFRPANGMLYGITDTDNVYIIDPNTGTASKPVTLLMSANKGQKSGMDFNPQLDRLRFNGSDDQNFSINVDDGTATRQTNLAYVAGDRNAGKDPNVTAAAYDTNVAKAPSTKLFGIDSNLDVLVLQDPPATGQLRTIGNGLGVDFGPKGGFDIFTDTKGMNTAFAVSGSTLYTIDLAGGTAKRVATIPRSDLIGLAIVPVSGGSLIPKPQSAPEPTPSANEPVPSNGEDSSNPDMGK